MSQERKRNLITREIILEILGKTEDNIKEGLSITDVLPFFVKYRLQLRVFNSFYKLIYQYDPPIRNHNNKALYCMMKGDHIYTLNHNIDALNHSLFCFAKMGQPMSISNSHSQMMMMMITTM